MVLSDIGRRRWEKEAQKANLLLQTAFPSAGILLVKGDQKKKKKRHVGRLASSKFPTVSGSKGSAIFVGAFGELRTAGAVGCMQKEFKRLLRVDSMDGKGN